MYTLQTPSSLPCNGCLNTCRKIQHWQSRHKLVNANAPHWHYATKKLSESVKEDRAENLETSPKIVKLTNQRAPNTVGRTLRRNSQTLGEL